jgi:haloalkane dehalogenase
MDVLRSSENNFSHLKDFPFEPHYLEVSGVRMHYVDEGPRDAPVILMMHGMPTWSYLYRHVIPVLVEAGYRCVAPDHIGFGRSDKVTTENWYNIAQHVTNMTSFIQQLNLSNVTIMVQDWGGPIGLAQVALMPERFSRIVIMNTWLHHVDYEYSPGIQQWISQWVPGGMFEQAIPSLFTVGGLMAMATQRITPQDSLLVAMQGGSPEYIGDALEVQKAYDAPFAGLELPGLAGVRRFPMCIPFHDTVAGDAQNQESNFEFINSLPLPIHFMWATQDNVFTLDWGKLWSSKIPHATWEEIEGAHHFLQDTHGVEIAQRLLAHMN